MQIFLTQMEILFLKDLEEIVYESTYNLEKIKTLYSNLNTLFGIL